MVDVAIYIEFKAKTLIKELSENFDIRKCSDLYQTLGDLLKHESESEFEKIPDPITEAIMDCYEGIAEPPQEKAQGRQKAVLKTRRKAGNHRLNTGEIFRGVKVWKDGICFLRKGFRRKRRVPAEKHLQYDQH